MAHERLVAYVVEGVEAHEHLSEVDPDSIKKMARDLRFQKRTWDLDD